MRNVKKTAGRKQPDLTEQAAAFALFLKIKRQRKALNAKVSSTLRIAGLTEKRRNLAALERELDAMCIGFGA